MLWKYEMPELPIELSSSMMEAYSCCPRKYYWRYVMNITSKGTSHHLTCGKAVHACIAEFMQSNDKTKALEIFDKMYVPGETAPLTNYQITGKLLPVKCWERVHDRMSRYCDFWANDTLRVEGVETKFKIPFNNNITLVGVRDIDAVDTLTGDRLIIDHKTMQQIRQDYHIKFWMHNQFDVYALSRRDEFPIGSVANIIAIRCGDDFNQSYDFLCRTQPFWRTALHIELIERNIVELWSMMNRSYETQEFPMLGKCSGTCLQWGKCPYWDLCLNDMDPDMVEAILNVQYQQGAKREWEDDVNDEYTED